MKKIWAKKENKILILLALFSISIGLWNNFRQLWLQDNGFNTLQISKIISIGTIISVIGIMITGKHITLNKLKKYIKIILIIKFLNLSMLYFINRTDLKTLIIISNIIDIVLEYIIVTSIYPLITSIVKSDTIYSKRKLTEYLFRDIGILIGGILIGKSIFSIVVNYNKCLIISNIFLLLAIIVIYKINDDNNEEENIRNSIIKYVLKNKIAVVYLIDVFIGAVAMSTALGLKMLTLTNYFEFSDSLATNYLLVIGLIADVIGIIALKWLTPKNDYITITIKFGIRLMGYIIAFLSNNLVIILIAMTWSILISTAYENICDGPYVNMVENEYQLSFTNLRYIIKYLGEAVRSILLWNNV